MLKRSGRGFTLIEIVLVLAIAGLIMVIVFLALSGAQKARRDTQRKGDLHRFVTGVESWAGNNRGVLPTLAQVQAVAFSGYFSGTDPGGPAYSFQSTAPAVVGQIQYQTAVFCPGVGGTPTSVNFAATIFTEQGGTYCRDNH